MRQFPFLRNRTVNTGAAFLFFLTFYGCVSQAPLPETPDRAPSPVVSAPIPPSPGKLAPYKIGNTWYYPIPHARGFKEKGLASWYGKDFHGKPTANGEIYNMYGVSAAHKTLPLGTWVRVKNKMNGKEIKLRVNDRGPFVSGRVIDLSFTAAKRLGIVGPGTAPVEVVALGAPGPNEPLDAPTHFIPGDYYSGNFVIQVGAFKQRANAEALVATLARKYQNPHFVLFQQGAETFYRVRVGRFSNLYAARNFEQRISATEFPNAFVVAE